MSDGEEVSRDPTDYLGSIAALLSLLLGVVAGQGLLAIRSRVFGNTCWTPPNGGAILARIDVPPRVSLHISYPEVL